MGQELGAVPPEAPDLGFGDEGFDLPLVMEILGHTKLDVTMLYMNRKSAEKRKALEGLLNRLTA